MPLEVIVEYAVLLIRCTDQHLAMKFWRHPAQFKPLQILFSKHSLSDDSNIGKVLLLPVYKSIFFDSAIQVIINIVAW